MKGLFITFEGPDGSGKTTQLQLLANYLREQGYDVVTTREPGGTHISDQIRKILLDPNHLELKNQTEILLYAASRAQLVHELIIPALEQGKIVLCDRYIDASIAYQSYGLGIDKEIVEEINRFASSQLQPNRTYLLYISPELGRERMIKRNNREFDSDLDRIEQKDIEYHERVYQGFSVLAEEYPNRILKIDANKSIEMIFEVIKKDFEKFLNMNWKEG
ncbi:dTMP kinase [Vulcanibacillus modesticaldus]|uniref:Thymidylate kinase n=1 Tax=Vulcanibacillus modesticaldus TaxID=337097 RepID=A0A1D2YX37_9BACI|nr:dTMP kinase [Vulcanibacillus modesticaldus]OEG00274.1 dTMP kinase [Vulcanibacillus modesticaldus]